MGTRDEPQAAAFNEAVDSVTRNTRPTDRVSAQRVEIGNDVLDANGRRYFVPANAASSNSVRVVLTRPAPVRIMAVMLPAKDLVAAAAARARPYASVHVGSTLAQLDAPALDRLFGQLFGSGGPVIGALGYTSLLEANIPINEVIDILDPGNPDQINEEPIVIAELLRRLVDALGRAGNDTAAEAARRLSNLADATATILPAEIVAIEREAARIVGGALINAGELTLLAAQAASESAIIQLAYALPPPLGDSTATIRVLDPGRPAVLATRTEDGDPEEQPFTSNAQAVLITDLGLASVPLLGDGLRLPLWIQLAQATAEVVDIRCARAGVPEHEVTVRARSSIGRIGIGSFDDINAPHPVPRPVALVDTQVAAAALGLPLPVRIRVTAGGMVDLPADERMLVFPGPFPMKKPIGHSDRLALREALQDLPSSLELDIRVELVGNLGGGLLGGVVGGVDATLNAALDGVRRTVEQALRARFAETLLAATEPLLAPALRETGLTLGGADIEVIDVVAAQPYLFTR